MKIEKNGVRRLQRGESQREIYRERDGRGDSGGDSAKGKEGELVRNTERKKTEKKAKIKFS